MFGYTGASRRTSLRSWSAASAPPIRSITQSARCFSLVIGCSRYLSGLASKGQPQRHLNQSRILSAIYPSKQTSIGEVPVGIKELRVIEEIKKFCAELQPVSLAQR